MVKEFLETMKYVGEIHRFLGLPDLPTASEDYRGKAVLVKGEDGVADILYVCEKGIDGTYSWISLGVAGAGDMTKAVYDPTDEGAIRLTPRTTSTGAEGTMFYDSDDNHVYVATE
jgi:hypothetical protein